MRCWLQEALAAAQKSIELDLEDAYAHDILGNVHFFNRDPRLAIRAFKTAVEINPNFPVSHFHVGQSKIAFGKAKEGVGDIEFAICL